MPMDHTATRALEYWDGRFPWGSREVLYRLSESTSSTDRADIVEIQKIKGAAFQWMEEGSPVDWESAELRSDLHRQLARQHPWCDEEVFERLWTWLRWLGWHDGY